MKTNKFKNGAISGMLALAILTTAIPAPKAEAASLADLQAQIQALLAQINNLKGNTGNSPSACTPFTIDLSSGRSGAEVTRLQNFLIGNGQTIPAGATGYFGGQTQSALAKFQAQNGISPAVGYFGPVTRAKVNTLCVTTPDNNNENPDSNNNSGTPILKGEASFNNFETKEGDDTSLEEGQKSVSVMDIEFDVEDGDARINRIDLGFTPDSLNNEKRPWRTFTEISVFDGNTRIAKIDATNRANWKENNPSSGSYMIRLSGLDYVAKEDQTVNLTVKVSTTNNIDGTNDGENWDVFVTNDGIRALDADKQSVYTGDAGDKVTFDIDKGGSGDELIVKRSNEDEDASTLILKEDNRSGYLKVFAFDLDTDDSKSDIEIRKLPLELTVSTGTVSNFMRDARIKVDGKTYTKKTVVDGSTNTMTFEFNRNEFVIEKGERVTVELEVEFKALDASKEGTTITAGVKTNSIVAEGSDDLNGNQLSGNATSELRTLRTKGIAAVAGSTSSEITSVSGALNDYATFKVGVKVSAFGQDVYIPVNVDEAINYRLEDSTGSALTATGTAVLSSNAKEQNGYFRIAEGETKNLTLTVTYLPGVQMTTARLQLMDINFNSTDDAPNQVWNALPASSYETETKTIVD